MIRAHKIKLNPTTEQALYFAKCAGTSRFVFNYGLARWKEAKAQGLKKFGPMAIKKELNAIKEEKFPWMYEVSKTVVESALVNLGKALSNYFDSKAGKRQGEDVGFPNFKTKKKSKQSFGVANDRFSVDGHNLKMQKCPGVVNMTESLRFVGKIMGATVSKVVNNWYISIQVEVEQPKPIKFEKKSVGIDLGVKTLATLSDGEQYENQALLRRQLNKLKKLNRQLSRRKQGSNRWYKSKMKLAKFHEGVKAQRLDIVHKMTTEIATTYELVGVEDLNVKGMVRNRRLALSISDASMGEILRQLSYKKALYGGILQKVGRFFASSKTCGDCGAINKDLKLSDRTWTCTSCGTIHDRDWNASRNIEVEALRLAYA